MSATKIESLPPAERPRERCLQHGAATLSLRECLAVLIGSGPPGVGCLGVADHLLQSWGAQGPDAEIAFFRALEGASVQRVPGMGDAAHSRILAAFELGRRYAHLRSSTPSQEFHGRDRPLHLNALEQVPQSMRSEAREWMGFVPLLRTGSLGRLTVVERGVRTHVNIDPAELFAQILALRPRGFYLFHNHPSGTPEPSTDDVILTARVAETSQSLGLALLGHGVLTSRSCYWIPPDEYADPNLDSKTSAGATPRSRHRTRH